jgi:hypothetical protein
MQRLRITPQNAALIMMGLIVLAYSSLGGGITVLLGINRLLHNGATGHMGFALTPPVLLVALVWAQPQAAVATRERTWVVLALLLLGLSLSSTILNLDRDHGAADDVMVLVWMFWYALPVLFFVGLLRHGEGVDLTRRLVEAVVVLGTFIYVSGIVAFVGSFGLPDAKSILFGRYDILRFTPYMDATYGHPANGGTGCMLAMLLPCAAGISRDAQVAPAVRWIARLFLIVAPINAVIGGSRTTMVIVLGWLVFWLVSVGSRRRRLTCLAILAGCAIAISVAMGPTLQIVFGDIVSSGVSESVRAPGETSASERRRLMGEFLDAALQRPALGWGPYSNVDYTAHEIFIHQAAEIGVAGSLVFVILFLALVWGVLRRGLLKHMNRGWYARQGALLYMLFGALANVPLGGIPPANTMAMILALLLASMLIEERSPAQAGSPGLASATP